MALTAPEEHERAAAAIVDSAYRVHRELGPGLLESVYETCLAHELTKRGFGVRRQVPVPVRYDGVLLDAALRIDLLVQELVIVEVKAAEILLPVHEAQLMTYMKLAAKRLGLLVNFNVPVITSGIRRRIL